MRILGRNDVGTRSIALWCLGIVVITLFLLSSLGVFSSKVAPKGTVVMTVTSSKYGAVLVVGGSSTGGLYKFPLYEFSGDTGTHLGCGTTKTVGYDLGAKENVPLTCTGPERDLLADVSSDDWPALTSKVAPVAGRGVNAKLLGRIFRKGIGNQITYGGHPLYLFDPSSQPFAPQGEDFIETVKPLAPWHGVWFLVSAHNGAPSPGVATIESEALPNGRHALAAEEDSNAYPMAISVYSGSSSSVTACTGTCKSDWTPVLTSAFPTIGAGVPTSKLGVLHDANGTDEVTYEHRVLYLYDQERILLTPGGRLETHGSTGDGSGERGPEGTMETVTLRG